MRSSGVSALLARHSMRVFTTGDFATLSGMAPSSASQAVRRLALAGMLGRAKRGLWVNRMAAGFHPYEVATRLADPWPAYVSLYSALSDEGIIAEVPGIVYAVTPAVLRRYRYESSFGRFHLHHLPPRLIWGYRVRHDGLASYAVADPEKAFCDLAYLGLTIRSPLGMPRRRAAHWPLKRGKVLECARRFGFPPLMAWAAKEPFSG
jgi:predicted transcriptional regulator of viral defense system